MTRTEINRALERPSDEVALYHELVLFHHPLVAGILAFERCNPGVVASWGRGRR